MSWKCSKGHKWKASVNHRAGVSKSGCPVCAESGFNPERPAWFYLMSRQGEQQFGITNVLDQRVQYHSSFGWKLIPSLNSKRRVELRRLFFS